MSTLYRELNSARVELALAIGEMQSLHDLANGRLNRCLRLVGFLEDSSRGTGVPVRRNGVRKRAKRRLKYAMMAHAG